MRLDGKTVVLGLTGGIACYKAVELVRLLVQAGGSVRVVMTAHAQAFVTPLTLQTLSGHPVATETFDLGQESEIGHIRLADAADAIVVAPATANSLAKLAHGLADDLLSTIALATRAPLVLAPAMNVHMWEHAATQANLAILLGRGATVVGPASGSLACGYEGPGRLSDPREIAEAVAAVLSPKDLAGESLLITAGPTQEAIDPVRYLSNHSSGKMGYALAAVARRRGARVTLVTGPTSLAPPWGVDLVSVSSAEDMFRAVGKQLAGASVVIMAAAVADYRPAAPAARKIKKRDRRLDLSLDRTQDILASVGRRKGRKILIGFAAETHELISEARRKLREKGADLIVANDVTAPGAGFGSDTNLVWLVEGVGEESLPLQSKEEVAGRILDWVVARRRTTRGATPRARRRSRE